MFSSAMAIIPWALFGLMTFFGMVFAIVAWRSTGRANRADDEGDRAKGALAAMEQRAQAAEARIAQAEQRAAQAEARISAAESEAQRCQAAVREAEKRLREAEQRAQGALSDAQRADAQLQKRKADADDNSRKADQRARALLDWARQQWEARREQDRQRAQAIQGSFQAQLEAYLDYRRAPVAFHVDGEVDRLAAPRIAAHATSERVQVDGTDVRVEFPVDPSQGFRA